MAKETQNIKTKCIGLRKDQLEWSERNDINFSKLVRRLVDEEIKHRLGDPTEDERKIEMIDNILDHFKVGNMGDLTDLIVHKKIFIEFVDRREMTGGVDRYLNKD
jgi:hypothetical protein